MNDIKTYEALRLATSKINSSRLTVIILPMIIITFSITTFFSKNCQLPSFSKICLKRAAVFAELAGGAARTALLASYKHY